MKFYPSSLRHLFSRLAFGLDLSPNAIRAVWLAPERGGRFRVRTHGERRLDPGVITPEGIVKPKTFAASIMSLMRELHLPLTVVTCVPEPTSYLVTIPEPSALGQNFEEEIRRASLNHIPLEPDNAVLDWVRLGSLEKGRLVVGATTRTIVDSISLGLKSAGLLPVAIEVEALAITRSLLAPGSTETLAVLDLGAERSSLIVVDRGLPAFTYSIPIGGNTLGQALNETLPIHPDIGPRALQAFGFDETRGESIVHSILSTHDSVKKLTSEISTALEYWKLHKIEDTQPPQTLTLTGGGSLIPGIIQYLHEALDLNVGLGNHLDRLTPDSSLSPSYTTAIGLAIRGTEF